MAEIVWFHGDEPGAAARSSGRWVFRWQWHLTPPVGSGTPYAGRYWTQRDGPGSWGGKKGLLVTFIFFFFVTIYKMYVPFPDCPFYWCHKWTKQSSTCQTQSAFIQVLCLIKKSVMNSKPICTFSKYCFCVRHTHPRPLIEMDLGEESESPISHSPIKNTHNSQSLDWVRVCSFDRKALVWGRGETHPPGWRAWPPLTAEYPRWCSGCTDASASSSAPEKERERVEWGRGDMRGVRVCVCMRTCVIVAYCCSQSFKASCRCCSQSVWMALICSSLWVNSRRSSSGHNNNNINTATY